MARPMTNVVFVVWFGTLATAYSAPQMFELTLNPRPSDSVVTIYNPSSGQLMVEGVNITISSYQVESLNGQFIPENVDPGFAVGPFDVATEFKMFTLRTGGVNELTIGTVLRPNISVSQLLDDLRVDCGVLP